MRGVLSLALSLALVACSSSDPEPNRLRIEGSLTTPSATSSSDDSYEISDVTLHKISDPVPGVFWVVTYDARWMGASEPQPARCIWRMKNAEGMTIVQGGFELEGAELDDRKAGDAYPDEIAGQPATADVTCA